MTPKLTENEEFAQWFRDWIATIQQNRTQLERTLLKRATTAAGQEYSDGSPLLDPKLRVAQGRHVAWSIQFDDQFPYEEHEEHRERSQSDVLCETIKRATHARISQVKLYDGPQTNVGFLHKQVASAHEVVARSSAGTSRGDE